MCAYFRVGAYIFRGGVAFRVGDYSRWALIQLTAVLAEIVILRKSIHLKLFNINFSLFDSISWGIFQRFRTFKWTIPGEKTKTYS